MHSLLYHQVHRIVGIHRVQQSTGALQLPADMLQVFQGEGADKTVYGISDLAFIPFRVLEGIDVPRHRVALHTLESQTIVRDTPSLPEKRVLGLVLVQLSPWYEASLCVPRETQRSLCLHMPSRLIALL